MISCPQNIDLGIGIVPIHPVMIMYLQSTKPVEDVVLLNLTERMVVMMEEVVMAMGAAGSGE